MYAVHWKARCRLPISRAFLLGAFVSSQFTHLMDGQTDGLLYDLEYRVAYSVAREVSGHIRSVHLFCVVVLCIDIIDINRCIRSD